MANRWFMGGLGLALLFMAAGAAPGDAGMAAATGPRVRIGQVPAGVKMVDAKIGSDGVIHLLFQKGDMPFYARSTDGGKTVGPEIPVLQGVSAVRGLEYLGWDMTVTDRGKVLAVLGNNSWQVKNTPADQIGLFLATLEPGAKTFDLMKSLNGVPSQGFSIVAGKAGDVTAAYLQGKLLWMHSTDGGKSFARPTEINKDYLPCPCCTTSLAVGKDGTLALLYREATDNKRDMYVVLSKNGQQKRTMLSRTLWKIDSCPMTYFSIRPAGDGFVAAWPTRGQAYFTRISIDGKIWPPGEIKVGGKTWMRSTLIALPGADDTTLIAWKSDEKLHWKIYDANGKPITEESQIPSPGPQAGAVVDRDGNFILFP
jgi:hypothetical protein